MKHPDTRNRLVAAEKLLRERQVSRQSFEAIRTLIKGINPQLDQVLNKTSPVLKKADQLYHQKVIDLTLEALPGKTKEAKRRQKLLLLLLKYWKQLRQEVKRVESLLEKQQQSDADSLADKTATGSQIVAYAKGPLGAVTATAVVIATGLMILKQTAVEIIIVNDGCQTLNPTVSVPVFLPGLSLPSQPIPSGAKATAIVPPLNFEVDGRKTGNLRLKAYGLNLNFVYPEGVEIRLDDQSLIGKTTQADLGTKKLHQLLIRCL